MQGSVGQERGEHGSIALQHTGSERPFSRLYKVFGELKRERDKGNERDKRDEGIKNGTVQFKVSHSCTVTGK